MKVELTYFWHICLIFLNMTRVKVMFLRKIAHLDSFSSTQTCELQNGDVTMWQTQILLRCVKGYWHNLLLLFLLLSVQGCPYLGTGYTEENQTISNTVLIHNNLLRFHTIAPTISSMNNQNVCLPGKGVLPESWVQIHGRKCTYTTPQPLVSAYFPRDKQRAEMQENERPH